MTIPIHELLKKVRWAVENNKPLPDKYKWECYCVLRLEERKWTSEELAELGPSLQGYILQVEDDKQTLRRLLKRL
jgi:hypothetical protein